MFNEPHIHFEITGDPFNLIGSHWCKLFMNCTILCSKQPFFPANETALLKHKNQLDFKACLKEPITLQENERLCLFIN